MVKSSESHRNQLEVRTTAHMSTHVRAKGRRVRSRSLFALAWQLLLMVAVSMLCGGRAHCSPWTEGEKTLLYLRVDEARRG